MSKDGIGQPIRRVEDRRLLLGRGRFVGDIEPPGTLHCVILRSPHAHAVIRGIDASKALAADGVVAILTGDDMARDGIGPMLCLWPITSAGGAPMQEPPRFALARGKVRHVGEAVAVVIAETRDQALDVAELVAVDYETLPAVTQSDAAVEPDAPLLHDGAPANTGFLWARGDAAAVKRGFAAAAHVVEIDIVNNRLVGAALEPRAVVAIGGDDGLTLYSSTQVPHHIRQLVTEQLGITESALRVVAPDVGGGFGYKGKAYPEETILAWAGGRLRRTLKWVATRSESFVADYQGRDHRTHAALALDAEGRFLALRVTTLANLGAYVSTFGAAIPSAIYTALLAGVYRTPAVRVEVTGVFTNTVPTDAYRGAGRPEACYVLERLADRAAAVLGIDRAEIRRRNLIPVAAMPYKTPIGPTYDCGDFAKVFARALSLADYAGISARKSQTPPGIMRGVGIACYVESSGVAPSRFAGALGARAGFFESATVRMQADGAVQAMLGTHSHGQGHATSFAQILSSRLGVPVARIEIVEGDTAIVPHGTGTFGSRSIAVGGCALDRAADKIVAKGKRIAAHLLEAADSDVAFADGIFAIAGTDRSLTMTEVAHEAYTAHHLPLETMEPGLHETAFYDPPSFAFSNGAHLCEVEVDCATGAVKITGYWAVDDIGTVINPMIVEGQLHGGAAQGIGQALLESCVYDGGSGQILSGSFLDYAMPRAGDLPLFVTELDESQPCTHNPLGAKGCGEAGAVAAPAAVVSAVLDALAPLGVTDLAMPLTPETIWRAINGSA